MKKYFTKQNVLAACAIIATLALVWVAYSLSDIASSLSGILAVNVY